MKMHFQRSKHPKRLLRTALALVPLLVVVVLAFGHVRTPDMLSGALRTLATPLWTVTDSVTSGAGALFGLGSDTTISTEEAVSLRTELATLRREAAATDAYRADNEALRALLGREGGTDGLVPAAVLRHDTIPYYDSFIIDLGLKDGVRDGMLVRTESGEALGYVMRALERTATIVRFSSPGLVTQAIVHGTSTMHTRLEGHGGGTMLMRVPQDIRATTGEPVLLPTFATIPLGTIAHIETSPEDALKTLYVHSIANTHEIRFVLVDSATIWRGETPPEDSAADVGDDEPAS